MYRFQQSLNSADGTFAGRLVMVLAAVLVLKVRRSADGQFSHHFQFPSLPWSSSSAGVGKRTRRSRALEARSWARRVSSSLAKTALPIAQRFMQAPREVVDMDLREGWGARGVCIGGDKANGVGTDVGGARGEDQRDGAQAEGVDEKIGDGAGHTQVPRKFAICLYILTGGCD